MVFLMVQFWNRFNSVITSHRLSHHIYADDTHIYIALSTPDTHCSNIKTCPDDIVHWMNESRLKLNADKIGFLIIGTQRKRETH